LIKWCIDWSICIRIILPSRIPFPTQWGFPKPLFEPIQEVKDYYLITILVNGIGVHGRLVPRVRVRVRRTRRAEEGGEVTKEECVLLLQ